MDPATPIPEHAVTPNPDPFRREADVPRWRLHEVQDATSRTYADVAAVNCNVQSLEDSPKFYHSAVTDSPRTTILNAGRSVETVYAAASRAERANGNTVSLFTPHAVNIAKDLSKLRYSNRNYSRESDTSLLMSSMCELLGETILAEVNYDLHGYIYNLENLTVRMRHERRVLQSAHTVPPEFIRKPLTEEGIRCITNNPSTCPINAAFFKALEDKNITSGMWILAKHIKTGRNSFAHPLCASHEFSAIAHAYAKSHALGPATTQLCMELAEAVRKIFDQDGTFYEEP